MPRIPAPRHSATLLLAGLCLAACLPLAACGPNRSPEAERARQQIIEYCATLPGQNRERCECIADNMEKELGEEDFQDLAQAVDGLNQAQDPSSALNAMGDLLHALSGAGAQLDRAFSDAERACRGEKG